MGAFPALRPLRALLRAFFPASLLALLLLAPILAPLPARPAVASERVVAGLSQNSISITTNFRGSEILVFGAVKREAPAPEGRLDVIVTVSGPLQTLTVRRKARRLGIWVNTDAVAIQAAPSFYAVATSGPWPEVLADEDDAVWKISIPRAIQAESSNLPDAPSFIEAMIRIKAAQDQYQMLPEAVTLQEQVLFSTAIRLPANLVEGNYRVRIFLLRDGRVIDYFGDQIGVRKAALESFLFHASREWPWLYGLAAILLAAALGWTASAAFRMIKT